MTGTPCIGKTSVSKLLSSKLDAFYINLTELAKDENLILGKNGKRNTLIVDDSRMRYVIRKRIDDCGKKVVIIDGHYAASIVPKRFVEHIFVLRRNPIELRQFMEKQGFTGRKLWENLACEILDVCLVEALNYQKRKICELDVTGKSSEEVVHEILNVLNDEKECNIGTIDWLGMLEEEGLLDEFLKI